MRVGCVVELWCAELQQIKRSEDAEYGGKRWGPGPLPISLRIFCLSELPLLFVSFLVNHTQQKDMHLGTGFTWCEPVFSPASSHCHRGSRHTEQERVARGLIHTAGKWWHLDSDLDSFDAKALFILPHYHLVSRG